MINFEKYKEFVKEVTSDDSNYRENMIQRLCDIEKTYGLNPSLLMTAAIGLSSESGEFIEIIKKAVFQGKPLDKDVQFHLKRELGDIMWYVANACRALDLTLDDIISENVDKLKSRYPGGEFDVHYSENRQDGDL
jgi:NTP pyrophosphatase (non-canonical NTP hydrolase)